MIDDQLPPVPGLEPGTDEARVAMVGGFDTEQESATCLIAISAAISAKRQADALERIADALDGTLIGCDGSQSLAALTMHMLRRN